MIACPSCKSLECECVDFDLIYTTVYRCRECGVIFAKDQKGEFRVLYQGSALNKEMSNGSH